MQILILIAMSAATVSAGEAPERAGAGSRRAEIRRQVDELRESAPRKRSTAWKISAAVLGAAMAADAASSWGRREANPLVAGAGGRFGWQGAAIKGGVLGGVLATQWILSRRTPQARSAFVWTNFATAGGLSGVAIRNWRTK